MAINPARLTGSTEPSESCSSCPLRTRLRSCLEPNAFCFSPGTTGTWLRIRETASLADTPPASSCAIPSSTASSRLFFSRFSLSPSSPGSLAKVSSWFLIAIRSLLAASSAVGAFFPTVPSLAAPTALVATPLPTPPTAPAMPAPRTRRRFSCENSMNSGSSHLTFANEISSWRASCVNSSGACLTTSPARLLIIPRVLASIPCGIFPARTAFTSSAVALSAPGPKILFKSLDIPPRSSTPPEARPRPTLATRLASSIAIILAASGS